MAQHQMTDAGNTETQFYQTIMRPVKWYQWFGKADDKDDDDGWTKVYSYRF